MPSQRLSTHLSWASGGGWPSIATTIAPAVMAGFWRHVLTQLPMVELQFFPMRPGEVEAEVSFGPVRFVPSDRPSQTEHETDRSAVIPRMPSPGDGG